MGVAVVLRLRPDMNLQPPFEQGRWRCVRKGNGWNGWAMRGPIICTGLA